MDNRGVLRALVLVIGAPIVASGALACSRGATDGPSCGAVGASFYALATSSLAAGSDVNPQIHRAVADQIPAMRDSIVRTCTESKWAAPVRQCLVRAIDRVTFEACEQQLTDEQRRTLDLAARGESAEGSSK